ncbi:unnamed protein product [Paramecium sonneborni]|uniref:Uncharacterized protein n=1 Tax=Paramecium sonneborni TaxID=65129 RepID=A0A8S1PXV3_9CILI|nr:unnamed protein product [Paramecium sonneborni]
MLNNNLNQFHKFYMVKNIKNKLYLPYNSLVYKYNFQMNQQFNYYQCMSNIHLYHNQRMVQYMVYKNQQYLNNMYLCKHINKKQLSQ